MAISAFGWRDNQTPALSAANLEAMHAAAGAYTDTRIAGIPGGGGGGSSTPDPVTALGNVTGTVALPITSTTGRQGFTATLIGDTILSAPSGMPAGVGVVDLKVGQDNVGGHALTLWAGITWAGPAPQMPQGVTQSILLSFVTMDGGVTWTGYVTYLTSSPTGKVMTAYAPTVTATYGVPTTAADVDAAHLSITFVAPASGNVLVTINMFVNSASGNNVALGLREGTTNLVYGRVGLSGGTSPERSTLLLPITGLTPGSQHTYKLAAVADTNTNGSIYAGNMSATGPPIGPATITVEPL